MILPLLRNLFILIALCFSSSVSAASVWELQWVLDDYSIAYQNNIYIWNPVKIDLSWLDELLKENYWDITLEYEWDIFGGSRINWASFERKFETSWEKTISLNIYATDTVVDDELSWEGAVIEDAVGKENQRQLIQETDLNIFVYEKSVPFIVEDGTNKKSLNDFIQSGKDLWVLVDVLGTYTEDNIEWKDIVAKLDEYKVSTPESSDYLVIWGKKEFLFSTLSQIQLHRNNSTSKMPTNVVLLSSFNTSILKSYIWNNINGKDFLNTAFIIDEALRLEIIKNPENITNLENEVETNSYNFTSLSQGNNISPYLFASQFINKLSNAWIPVSDIYIILLLPLFLTCVSFAKHMIGVSTIWSIIPVFMAILFIKLSILFTLWILWFLLICNIIISRFINKYALLYTPKVACITILNLLAFMLFYHVLTIFNIIQIPLDNVLYIAIFFVIAEKFITIITSKEFREYRKSISWTVIVSLLCFLMFQFDGLRVFLMAYPEILLLFVPLNFFIWRFTGLRVTEYFRFREIIQNTEE